MEQHNEFPKWKYHRSLEPRIVHDPEEESALGEGWADTPAAFAAEPQSPEPVKKPKKSK